MHTGHIVMYMAADSSPLLYTMLDGDSYWALHIRSTYNADVFDPALDSWIILTVSSYMRVHAAESLVHLFNGCCEPVLNKLLMKGPI